MIVPASLRRRFERCELPLAVVEKVVWETISSFCVKKGFAVSGRRKRYQSLAEKIETGRYRCWSELDDLYACKIIVPTLDEEEPTLKFLQQAFEHVRIAQRGSSHKWPDVFRFDSTRFVGRLRDNGDASQQDARGISFEVQVLTAFEHAWSTTTHALAYKTGELDWRTKRIAAQLRASIEQLDMIVIGAGAAARHIAASPCPELDEQRALVKGFQTLINENRIPEELTPSTWSRFAENVSTLLRVDRRTDHRINPDDVVRFCREASEAYTSATFPRLISLLQFVLGVLLRSGSFSLPVRRYTPLLTEEFRQVFPEIDCPTVGFDLEG